MRATTFVALPMGVAYFAALRGIVKTSRRFWLLAALALVTARFAWEVLRALDVFADYHAYYRAAANLRAGTDIYAEGILLVSRNNFDFWTQTDGQYVYPPLLAILLLPLTILDIGKGGPTWLLALVLAALAAPWLIARLLGHRVGLYPYLNVALPTWALLPLALGIRYGLVAATPVALAAAALVSYLLVADGAALRGVAAQFFVTPGTPNEPDRRSPGQSGGEPSGEAASERTLIPLRLVTLALPALAALLLAMGWRDGRIDAFLLKLAAPGLVGTTLLPWLRALPLGRGVTLRNDFAPLVPLAIAVLGATPLLLGLRFGQPDILLLLLTTLALLAHLRRRDLLAGVLLGAAAAVKPTLALYGLYYLKKRAWGTLCTAALTGATLGLAPFLLLGPAAFADWFAISRYFGGPDYGSYPNNQSLRGLLLRAFVGGPQHEPLLVSPLLATILWLLVALAVLALWWRFVPATRQPPLRAVAEYALTIALILFAAPLSEDIHYVALLLPLAFLADELAHAAQTLRWRILAAVALLAFLLPLPVLAERVAPDSPLHLLASAPYLYGLLPVAAALMLWLNAARRQSA